MVRRDPRTGKFVSGGSGRDWADLTRVGGVINMTIPAADLAGGVRTEPVNGEEAELIDFTPMLENDEVFETVAATVSASLILPTSATAEGNAMLSFELGAESGTPGELMNQDPTFYGGVETASDGVVDIKRRAEKSARAGSRGGWSLSRRSGTPQPGRVAAVPRRTWPRASTSTGLVQCSTGTTRCLLHPSSTSTESPTTPWWRRSG